MNKVELVAFFEQLADVMQREKENLIAMDSVVGDGDLGLTMSDGFAAAYNTVKGNQENDLGKLIYFGGKAMSTAVPSTMGTLMASGLMQAGKALRGKSELAVNDEIAFFKAYEEGVAHRGKAKIGEKTFLDGFHPGVEKLENEIRNGSDLKNASIEAEKAAESGYENTGTMIAIHGRAATRGENSRSLKDPGAYVAKLIFSAYKNLKNF